MPTRRSAVLDPLSELLEKPDKESDETTQSASEDIPQKAEVGLHPLRRRGLAGSIEGTDEETKC